MTVKELCDQATELDLSRYDTGVEEFKLALADLRKIAYPEVDALITAWKELGKEVMEPVAYPSISQGHDISTLPDIGIDETEKALLGDYYFVVAGKGTTIASANELGNTNFATEKYHKIGYGVKATSGKAEMRIQFQMSDNTWLHLNSYSMYFDSANDFQFIDCTNAANDSNSMALLMAGTQNFKSIRYMIVNNNNSTEDSEVYIGSLMGYKYEYETNVPDVSTMTVKELCDQATELDLTQYDTGVEGFKLALAEVKALLPIEYVTVTVNAEENGTVSEVAEQIEKGIQMTVNATANVGYVFNGWYVGEEKVSDTAEYTFTADADIALVAKFAVNYGDANFDGEVNADDLIEIRSILLYDKAYIVQADVNVDGVNDICDLVNLAIKLQ